MKFIYSICFILTLFCSQNLVAQNITADENGRTSKDLAKRKPVNTHNISQATARNEDPEIGEREDKDEGVYPPAEESSFLGKNELEALNAQIDATVKRLEQLELTDPQQQTDIDNIKKSLQMCCGNGTALTEDGERPHLLQNSPNPFAGNTDIQFFIPENTHKATLQIRDLNGLILETHPITQSGIGNIQLKTERYGVGTYIYTLEIDGQIADSKIMILAK